MSASAHAATAAPVQVVPCDNCGGEGTVLGNPSWTQDPQAAVDVRCPACGGRGLRTIRTP